METAVAAGSFRTLAKALQAADLVDTLKGDGPFTVFAPTDEAFAKLPAGNTERPAEAGEQGEAAAHPHVSRRLRTGIASDVVKLKLGEGGERRHDSRQGERRNGDGRQSPRRQDGHPGVERRHPCHRLGDSAGRHRGESHIRSEGSVMKMISMVVMALLAGPAAAFAQEEGVRGRGRNIQRRRVLPAGGEFHEGGSGTVLGLATSVDAKTNADVFDPGLGGRAGIGYGIARRVELFADFAWNRAGASELSVGNVASLDLRAAFGDHTSYGMDAGMRYHFAPGAKV